MMMVMAVMAMTRISTETFRHRKSVKLTTSFPEDGGE